jgi:hypothetical protein
MSMTPEGRVKHAVKKILSSVRCWWFMPVQNGMGRVGIPDFICCIPVTIRPEDVGRTLGVFFAIETKAPGKSATLTPNQRREIESIQAATGLAEVIENPQLVELMLRNIGVYAYTTLESNRHAQVNTAQTRVSKGLQRQAGEREEARDEQRSSSGGNP